MAAWARWAAPSQCRRTPAPTGQARAAMTPFAMGSTWKPRLCHKYLMRVRLKQLRGAILRRVKYKITRGGLLFTLAVLLVGISAVVSANNLLFLILAMMLSTLLVSGFLSRLSLAGLQLDFTVPPHISAGRTVAASIYIRNLKSWIPSFSIHLTAWEGSTAVLGSALYFPVIPGGALLEETAEARFTR